MRIASEVSNKPLTTTIVGLAAIFATTIATAQDRPFLNRSNPDAAKCDELHAYLYRYDIESVSQHNTGRRFVSDVALALCARGDYERGIGILETETRNAGLPPVPTN